MFMRIELQVHAVLVEEILQSKRFDEWHTLPDGIILISADSGVVSVGAVHGAMAHRDDPRSLFPILRLISLLKE